MTGPLLEPIDPATLPAYLPAPVVSVPQPPVENGTGERMIVDIRAHQWSNNAPTLKHPHRSTLWSDSFFQAMLTLNPQPEVAGHSQRASSSPGGNYDPYPGEEDRPPRPDVLGQTSEF